MQRPRSIWRAVSRVLLGYQVLIAAAITAFGAWIAIGAWGCGSGCGVGAAFLGVLGFVWVTQALVAGVAVTVLFVLTTRSASRGAAVANIVVEALLLLPAFRFLEVMGRFGLPGAGLYALGAAIAATVVIIILGILELFASDRWFTSHRSIAVACLAAIPFVVTILPGIASAYSSAQIGSDGFPVGPVTTQFVQEHGSKLDVAFPGSHLTYTRATAESKTFNRFRMASFEERLAKDGLRADAEAWYQSSLRDAGWQRLCNAGGCQKDVEMVFFRGSRECVTVLVTSDGVGEIVIDYQITPSQKPLSGDPTADLRYCTGQY
jgi:hypothetical protein